MIGRALTARGVAWRVDTVVDRRDADALPPVAELAGVVILGGPMGALDVEDHPGLALEARLVREAIDAAVPLLGVCLGHQIIATALGGTLHPAAAAEFGIGSVDVLTDDAAFGAPGDTHPVLHWHRDVVEAPAGATVLAGTAQTANQAFRIGSAIATQFHLEVDRPLLDDWLAAPAMAADLGADVRERIVADFTAAEPGMRRLGDAVFDQFARAAQRRH